MGPHDESAAISHLSSPLAQWWTLTPEDKEAWLMDIIHQSQIRFKSRFTIFIILERRGAEKTELSDPLYCYWRQLLKNSKKSR